jgi:hypothetical protein
MAEQVGVGFPEGGSVQDRVAFLTDEIRKVMTELDEYRVAFKSVTHVAPAKPREGMVRFADGTNWNPGAGTGYYAYVSGAWAKL